MRPWSHPHVLHDTTCTYIERTADQLARLTGLYESGDCLSSTDLIEAAEAWIRPCEADAEQIIATACKLKEGGLMGHDGPLYHIHACRWYVSGEGTLHLDTPTP